MKTNKKNNNTAVAIYKANEVLPAIVLKAPDDVAKNAINISSDLIDPSNYNSRKTFDMDALRELAQSISIHGLIQPITVRKKGTRYEIICGERRFRACRLLNFSKIPAIVREATDEQAYDLSVLENLQRVDIPPMEAAEAYKRLIDTKRYDIPSLAVQYGKSEKSVYQMLKLCDLISGIADLVRVGKLTASAGIAISKYDNKIQADILKNHLGEDGIGEWCHISAGVLDNKIHSSYTKNLDNYPFDKTECMKCSHNSINFDLFNSGNGCGECTDKKCLSDKQTAYLVEQAQAAALKDPKLIFVGEQYYSDNAATIAMKNGGYEFKNVNTYSLQGYPTAPPAPQASNFSKPKDFEKARGQYGKLQEKYQKAIIDLEELNDQGKIRMYAKIEDSGIKLYYKEIENKDTKTTEEIITNLTAKKARNRELQAEKTASDLKELLRKNDIPQSVFTADEETAMYFFMLSELRRCNYKAVGLKEDDYYSYMTDKKKLKVATSLTEQQKTIIRRDYLHSHIMQGINTVSNEKGGILLAFSKQHLPEKTESIIATYKDEYDKKNNRLDERITELKKAQKKSKAKTKMQMAGIPEPQSKTTSVSVMPEATSIPCVG